MLSTPVRCRADASRHAAKLARVVALGSCSQPQHALGLSLSRRHQPAGPGASSSRRHFSVTPATQLRDFFPVKDTPHILKTKAAWPHHGYTMEEMTAVVPAHRKPRTFGDWAAWKLVRMARYFMDKATCMDRNQQVDQKNPTTAVEAEKPLTEAQWVRVESKPAIRIH